MHKTISYLKSDDYAIKFYKIKLINIQNNNQTNNHIVIYKNIRLSLTFEIYKGHQMNICAN